MLHRSRAVLPQRSAATLLDVVNFSDKRFRLNLTNQDNSAVAVLWNPVNAGNGPQLREAEVAARALGVRLQPLEARSSGEIDSAFAAMSRERAGAVIVLVDGVLIDNRTRITRLAEKTRLPAVYGIREYAEGDGLMFYGANLAT